MIPGARATTDALVLQAAPWRETSLRMALLTPEHGVVGVLARGARRGARQTPAAYEPLALIQATLRLPTASGGLGSLHEAALLEGWPALRADWARWGWAALGVEIIGALAEASPAEPFYFNEVCAYLQILQSAAGPGSLAALLLLRLLHHAGYPPHPAEAWTADTLPAELWYRFDMNQLMSIDGPMALPPGAMRLPRRVLIELWPALHAPPPLDAPWTLTRVAGPPVLRWLLAIWRDHLGRPLRAAEFVDAMLLRTRPEAR